VELEGDTFDPEIDSPDYLTVSGGGPSGLVLDSSRQRLYVLTRFDNAVSVVDLGSNDETSHIPLHNPEPASVLAGRPFLYDALLTSSNGEANCNVCHPAGDKDDLAWDLGSPFDIVRPNNNPFFFRLGTSSLFNPLKGPMTALTLRGIADSGPMFWRGEATNTFNPLNDERENFRNFNAVFEALLGRERPLGETQFGRFSDWALSILPPPNPHRPLDNQLTPSQQSGSGIFFGAEGNNDVLFNCGSCHGTDPLQGFFGTRGQSSFENEPQEFKITQLRTTYDKVGMFGATRGTAGDERTKGGPRVAVGPQIRGSGTLHDGSFAGVDEFLTFPVFSLNARQLQQVTDFVYAFPSNLAPIVGQQVTLHEGSAPDARARVELLMRRASAGFVIPRLKRRDPGDDVPPPPPPIPAPATECELVAKTVVDGAARGFVFEPGGPGFRDDLGQLVAVDAVLALGARPGQPITFTCLYPGGGLRAGIDRDLDGILDGSDPDAGVEDPLAALARALELLRQLIEILKTPLVSL
jgi:mono/diheme cytochrome c family protein